LGDLIRARKLYAYGEIRDYFDHREYVEIDDPTYRLSMGLQPIAWVGCEPVETDQAVVPCVLVIWYMIDEKLISILSDNVSQIVMSNGSEGNKRMEVGKVTKPDLLAIPSRPCVLIPNYRNMLEKSGLTSLAGHRARSQ
jgi:hypothetical protein